MSHCSTLQLTKNENSVMEKVTNMFICRLPFLKLTNDGSRSIFCSSGRVSNLWVGFEFGKFPLKMSNFSIFCPTGQKYLFRSKAGRLLIFCRSKVSSGQGPSLELTLTLIYLQLTAAWKL